MQPGTDAWKYGWWFSEDWNAPFSRGESECVVFGGGLLDAFGLLVCWVVVFADRFETITSDGTKMLDLLNEGKWQ